MYVSHNTDKLSERYATDRTIVYNRLPSEDALNVISKVEAETADIGIGQSIHFSTGVLNRIERQLTLGCTIITDTKLILAGIDQAQAARLPIQLECFIDDPLVVNFATQKRITRAEIAIERALSVNGPKLVVVGSAPMALNRLLQIHQQSPLREITIIAAANGFANIVELKERVWESGLPCIVIRGRKGGANAAIAIVNALVEIAAGKMDEKK